MKLRNGTATGWLQSQITLPPAPNVDAKHFDVYQNFEIEAGNRDALRDFLKEHDIGTIIQWGGYALHQIEALAKDMHFDISRLPRTELLFKHCLMLPFNTSVTDDEVDYICETISKFYR